MDFTDFIPPRFLLDSLAISSIFIALFVALLFLGWPLLIQSFYPKFKEVEPEAPRILPSPSEITHQIRSKNVGISDSLLTFSEFGPNDHEVRHYDRLAEEYCCPDWVSVIDSHLIATLRRTGELTRKLNDHLEELALRGVNAMIIFVFQVSKHLK
jgi:hypothetical protein